MSLGRQKHYGVGGHLPKLVTDFPSPPDVSLSSQLKAASQINAVLDSLVHAAAGGR